MSLRLNDQVNDLPGVGPKYQLLLEKVGIKTIEDILWHLPFRYEDRTNIKKISELIANEKAVIIGKVEKISNVFTKYGKRITKATVADNTGKLEIVWFNQIYLAKSIPAGTTVKLFGQLDQSSNKLQFTSPEYEIYKDNEHGQSRSGFIPVYSTTNGVTNNWIKSKIDTALKQTKIEEIFEPDTLKTNNLVDIKTALNGLHNSENLNNINEYKRRLAFEELLFLHLHGLQTRAKWDSKKNSHKISLTNKDLQNFKKQLPFELTNGQNQAMAEILDDLGQEAPMNRLLQGDVGSGKTVVAASAVLASAKSGFNSIIMAPTQILAEQHFLTLQKLFKNSEINLILLTGKDKPKNIKEPYLVVSTHAILHNLESFGNIGLIIVDEQHKFGVDQRTVVVDYYTQKSELADRIPNLLTMTATPIPRSMALTFYGDLDLSVINEIPKTRKGVKTWVISEAKRKKAYEWIEEEIITKGIQAFVVCPFIEESDNLNLQNVKAAELEYERLIKVFSNIKVGLLHGKLKADEKNKVIQSMINNEIQILVTTPVIEVGVDIPNANIILIETPERFGLASLHQLRGRVGRGDKEGFCFLITSTKTQSSVERLKYMERVNNGNELAEIDLKLRGPGDIYGTSQHGFMELKAADITDIDLIKKTKALAEQIFTNIKQHPKILDKLNSKKYVEEN